MIKNHSKITLHFTIRLTDGSVADSTKARNQPAIVQLGDGTLSDAMEQQLYGLKIGEKKTFTLAPEDGAGLPQAGNIHQLPRHQFPENMLLEEGLIIEFQQQGQTFPGIIRHLNTNYVTVDFNHPLAGQTLLVDVEIIAIEE